jgi:hypothetical protein
LFEGRRCNGTARDDRVDRCHADEHELESALMPMLDKYEVVLAEDPEDQIRWYGR